MEVFWVAIASIILIALCGIFSIKKLLNLNRNQQNNYINTIKEKAYILIISFFLFQKYRLSK